LKTNANGFSLIELIVAITLVGILAAISFPMMSNWMQNARYKEGARDVASILRDARARSIAKNLEYEVGFDLGADRYMLRQGNLAYNTRSFTDHPEDWTVLATNLEPPSNVDIVGLVDCSNDDASDFAFSIQFNPNGTGTSKYVCILDKATGGKKFRIGVPSATTGRVTIQKWNETSNNWQ